MSKECTVCKLSLKISEFSKNIKNRDGYLHQCKKCVRKRVLKWRSENPEEAKSRRKVQYFKRRDKNIMDAVEWGKVNREKRNVAKNKWRAKNKPLTNHYTKMYLYRQKRAAGSHTLEEYLSKLYMFSGKCAYCRERLADTRDHVIPLSKGGTNFIDNIVPACRSCNSSKRDKLIVNT